MLLLINENMPENYSECPCASDMVWCTLKSEGVDPTWEERPEDCPLVELVTCKDCAKHNAKVGFDENFHTVWKEEACPLVDWRGKAQGHEFDYQYCAFAERREE